MKITAIICPAKANRSVINVVDLLKTLEEVSEIVCFNKFNYSKSIDLKYIKPENNNQRLSLVRKGVEQSTNENILLIDPEITGLNKYFLKVLIECFKDGFDMAILDYGVQQTRWVKKLTKIFPALSTIRIFKRKDFVSIDFDNQKNTILENILNNWYLKQNKKIAVVPGGQVSLPNELPEELKDYPFFSKMYLNTKVYKNLINEQDVVDFPEVVKQWREIAKKQYTTNPKTKPISVSAIVPAYNEEKNIVYILRILKTISELTEIIVVDDGSSDRTAILASNLPGVRVITNTKNMGKTRSVIAGIKVAKNDAILMVDADLVGLESGHIQELIDTYKLGMDMVILDYGNQEFYLRKIIRSFPALSGVRIISKKEFGKIKFTTRDRFELENRINKHYLDNQLSVIVINGDTVHTPHKYEKYSFHKGIYLEARALREIFLSEGVSNIGKLVKSWWTINARRK